MTVTSFFPNQIMVQGGPNPILFEAIYPYTRPLEEEKCAENIVNIGPEIKHYGPLNSICAHCTNQYDKA